MVLALTARSRSRDKLRMLEAEGVIAERSSDRVSDFPRDSRLIDV